MKVKKKIIRVTTVPVSLKILLKGQLLFMSNYFEVIGVSSNGKELTDVKEESGIRVIPLQMTRKISPPKDLKSLFQFYLLVRRERPLIVHSHTPKAGLVAMVAAKLAGVPFRLHTVAGMSLMEAKGIKRKILNLVEMLTYYCATKVFPNSLGLYDFILTNNFTFKSKLKVLANGSSNGIDTSYFSLNNVPIEEQKSLKKALGITDEVFLFVYVGRLVKDKGINEIIQAFQKTVSGSDKVKLLLVGSFGSDLDPLYSDTIKEICSNKNIISVGFQNDVRPNLAVSDCLVLPSYREGFPSVVMQAGAMELPSIVTNTN